MRGIRLTQVDGRHLNVLLEYFVVMKLYRRPDVKVTSRNTRSSSAYGATFRCRPVPSAVKASRSPPEGPPRILHSLGLALGSHFVDTQEAVVRNLSDRGLVVPARTRLNL